jgi:hypothetical protein
METNDVKDQKIKELEKKITQLERFIDNSKSFNLSQMGTAYVEGWIYEGGEFAGRIHWIPDDGIYYPGDDTQYEGDFNLEGEYNTGTVSNKYNSDDILQEYIGGDIIFDKDEESDEGYDASNIDEEEYVTDEYDEESNIDEDDEESNIDEDDEKSNIDEEKITKSESASSESASSESASSENVSSENASSEKYIFSVGGITENLETLIN